MSRIQPRDPELLTTTAVDPSAFQCCGNEELIFLKCPHCQAVWVECLECSTWYTDLTDLNVRESSYLGSDEQRLACPACQTPFADVFYLADENCDRYLARRDDVIRAGGGRFLATALRPSAAESTADGRPTNRPVSIRISVGANRSVVIGAAIGTTGWILALAFALANAGQLFEAGATFLSAAAVMAVGFLIVSRATRGKLITLFHAVLNLLAASFGFGLAALLIAQSRGALEPILDPEGEFPVLWNFAAPAVVLLMIATAFLPPIRRYLLRQFV